MAGQCKENRQGRARHIGKAGLARHLGKAGQAGQGKALHSKSRQGTERLGREMQGT
jgi:hypothetical protein